MLLLPLLLYRRLLDVEFWEDNINLYLASAMFNRVNMFTLI